MASPEVLDLGKLLAPIPGANPAGTDLRAEGSPGSAYYTIKDARSAARAAERLIANGDAEAAPPDWRPVQEHAVKALAGASKDLEVAAFLIEALVRRHGFAGLRDGFRLALGLVEGYWDQLYPLPDEDGLETRVAPLTGLNGDDAEGTLLAPIAAVPITEATSVGRFSCVDYRQAMALAKIADPKLREKRTAAGALTLETFQKAVAESSPAFYEALVQDLAQCQQAFDALGAALDARCGAQAPPSSAIRAALADGMATIRDAARARLPAAPSRPAEADGAAAAEPPAEATGSPAPLATPDAIRTREDAFRALQKVADYFRDREPHTVVSFALEQVIRWGRMPLPELFQELIPDDGPRKALFKQVGIRAAEPAKEEKK